MVTFAQRSTGHRMVSLPDDTVAVVKSVLTPGSAGDLLSVFRERSAEISLVEIAHNDNKTVSIFEKNSLTHTHDF